jgi:hypothetical protein
MDAGGALDAMKADIPQFGFGHPQLVIMIAPGSKIFGKGEAQPRHRRTKAARPAPVRRAPIFVGVKSRWPGMKSHCSTSSVSIRNAAPVVRMKNPGSGLHDDFRPIGSGYSCSETAPDL